MMSLWDALRMNMMISYQELVRTFPKRWYRLRYHQLQKQPLCEFHLRRNQVISATVVDHIKPHKGDETLFHNPDNLQSLCKRCHDSVKQRMEKGGTVTEFDNEGRVIW